MRNPSFLPSRLRSVHPDVLALVAPIDFLSREPVSRSAISGLYMVRPLCVADAAALAARGVNRLTFTTEAEAFAYVRANRRAPYMVRTLRKVAA